MAVAEPIPAALSPRLYRDPAVLEVDHVGVPI